MWGGVGVEVVVEEGREYECRKAQREGKGTKLEERK